MPKKNSEIATQNTNLPVCPHCFEILPDSDLKKYDTIEDKYTNVKCINCNKTYRFIPTFVYDTEKIEEPKTILDVINILQDFNNKHGDLKIKVRDKSGIFRCISKIELVKMNRLNTYILI